MAENHMPFYGFDQEDLAPISPDFHGVKSIRNLFQLLTQAWCADTCAPRMRDRWTSDCPSFGQCSVTAFLVQDLFGGRVYGVPLEAGGVHCYNLIEGHIYDLTSAQFEENSIRYEKTDPEQFRETHFLDAEKLNRYQLLKNRLSP